MRKVEYKVDSFTDYTGVERKFVLAALSISDESSIYIEESNEEEIESAYKVLTLGISVCRANDTFNEELGKKIAEGKANKYRNHAIYTTDSGLINATMVKALLEQEATYFKANPGRYLIGYDKDKQKYEKSERIEKYIDSLNENEKKVFNYCVTASDKELSTMGEAVEYTLGKND